MKQETRERLEKLQEEIRQLAEEEKITYTDDVYGMMIMLDSVLNDNLTVQDAVNEFIANSDLEIQSEVIETKVIQE